MMNYSNVSIIYVSQKNGNEWYSGFTPVVDEIGNGPLKSIEQAIEKICQLRVSGNFRPITVRIIDNEYFLDKPIELNPKKLLPNLTTMTA